MGLDAQGVTVSLGGRMVLDRGSSFAAPIYEAWGAAAKRATNVAVNYQSVGSSAGQNQILAGTVDFGASDAPMDAAKLEKGSLFQFPTVMGGIVPRAPCRGPVPSGTGLRVAAAAKFGFIR